MSPNIFISHISFLKLEWNDAYTELRTTLGLDTDEPIPAFPNRKTQTSSISDNPAHVASDAKRKAGDEGEGWRDLGESLGDG